MQGFSPHPISIPWGFQQALVWTQFFSFLWIFSVAPSNPSPFLCVGPQCLETISTQSYLWPDMTRTQVGESHCPSCPSLWSLSSHPHPWSNLRAGSPPPGSTPATGDSSSCYRHRVPVSLSSLSLQNILCLTATYFPPYFPVLGAVSCWCGQDPLSSFLKPPQLSSWPSFLPISTSRPVRGSTLYQAIHSHDTFLRYKKGSRNQINETLSYQRQEEISTPKITSCPDA